MSRLADVPQILPKRSRSQVPSPDRIEQQRSKGLVEGDSAVWLWKYPELLGWPEKVLWFYCPALGQSWPGDFWGLDEKGRLLLVEGKFTDKPSQRRPFEDYLNRDFSHFETATLRAQWEEYLAKEDIRFSWENPHEIGHRAIPGVLPYGSRRRPWGRWKRVYQSLDGFLRSEYRRRLSEYFERREHLDDSELRPFFFGYVFGWAREPQLSAQGWSEYDQLSAAYPGRVFVRAVSTDLGPEHISGSGEVLRETCTVRSWSLLSPS